MSKAYLYKGKKYSNAYWRDTEDNIFDGDIWMLLEALAEDKRTKLEKHIYTFFLLDGEQFTDDSMDADEDLIEDMFEEGYLDNVDIKELPTEDDQPNINYDQTEYTVEVDPDSPFGVE